MKKILILLCCLLAPALMAQEHVCGPSGCSASSSVSDDNGYVRRAVDPEVYEALLVVNGLRSNSNMTTSQAEKILKGTIVVEAGFPACSPCGKMIKAIEEAGLLSKWEQKNIRFYQLNSTEDEKKKNSPNLINWMKRVARTYSVPLLFVIKDGKVVAIRKGYNSEEKDSFLQKLEKVTLQ